jgi:hypothetical protein
MDYKEKHKTLLLLIDRVTSRLAAAEEEKAVMNAKLQKMQSALENYESLQNAARDLKQWKTRVSLELKKLSVKVSKEIDRIEEQSSRPNI